MALANVIDITTRLDGVNQVTGGLRVIERQTATLTNRLAAASQKMRVFGTSMVSSGKMATIGITVPIIAAGAGLIKFAADAEESENLFEVAMGGMAGEARVFSEDLRKELGLNAFEVRENTAVFFQMFDAMGLGKTAAFGMSTGLVQLANDMASFRNIKPEEAFEKLRAGITGETEPLKRLGILVDETTIKQVAMTAGIIKQGETLTQQQKVIARYIAIIQQTSVDQGDLARTLDSTTNVTRRMKTEFSQMAIELGTELLPLFNQFILGPAVKMLEWVKDQVAAFKALSPQMQKLIAGTVAMVAAIGPLLIIGGLLIKTLGLMAGALRLLATRTGKIVAGFAALAAVAAVVALKWKNASEGMSEAVEDTIKVADEASEAVLNVYAKTLKGLAETAASMTGETQKSIKTQMKFSQDLLNFEIRIGRKTLQNKLDILGAQLFEVQKGTAAELRVRSQIVDVASAMARKEVQRLTGTTEVTKQEAIKQLGFERLKFQAMGELGTEAAEMIRVAMQGLTRDLKAESIKVSENQQQLWFIDISQSAQLAATNVKRQWTGMFTNLLTDARSFKERFGDFWKAVADTILNHIGRVVASRVWATLFGGAASLGGGGALAGGLPGGGGGGGGGGIGSLVGGAGNFLGSGTTGGLLSQVLVGGAAGGLIGNLTGGSTVGGAVGGVAGNILGPLAFGAFAPSIVGGLTSAGLSTGFIELLGAAAGPIGLILGALAGAAIGKLIGPEPSNMTAMVQGNLTTGEFRIADQLTADFRPGGRKFSERNFQIAYSLADLATRLTQGLIAEGGELPNSSDFFIKIGNRDRSGWGFGGLQYSSSTRGSNTGDINATVSQMTETLSSLIAPASVRGFQTGTDSIFSHPSLISVAETGPERVRVTAPGAGKFGGGGTTIVFQGPAVLDDISMLRFTANLERAALKRRSRHGG